MEWFLFSENSLQTILACRTKRNAFRHSASQALGKRRKMGSGRVLSFNPGFRD
jgi:hypothetical protein